ncbi:MAG: hypothetical protein JSW54_13505 [Fidelibacterota bacterium]|nr:MAG: hypothetical protein JSW54_13505 [Candidatus Neomarinimicrobiota bacterium]
MRRIAYIIIPLSFLLWQAGCEERQPELIQKVFFTDDDRWLDRNEDEDPYELVDGDCCNDYNPFPLSIDTDIEPVIAPSGDLDYFDIQIPDSLPTLLFLTSERDNMSMRLFRQDMEEEYEFLLDTLHYSLDFETVPVYWTLLHGEGTTFTVLVKGDTREAQGGYTLSWRRVTPIESLEIDRPREGDQWRRSNWEIVSWSAVQGRLVTAALLRGPVVVRKLTRGSNAIYNSNRPEVDWHIPDNLKVGTGYRILVYYTANPQIMNISNEFQIY